MIGKLEVDENKLWYCDRNYNVFLIATGFRIDITNIVWILKYIVMLRLCYFCMKQNLSMSLTTLKEDLLAEFREERIMITDQLEMLDPLATSLRKPAAQRLLSSSTLFITEFSCYIVSLGGIAFAALMHRIYPFSLLHQAFYNPELRHSLGVPNITLLIAAIYGLVAIAVVTVFVIARMAREIRLKNDILQHASRDIKTITGQHLERKAAINAIEQRHLLGMSEVIQMSKPKDNVTEVVNAAY